MGWGDEYSAIYQDDFEYCWCYRRQEADMIDEWNRYLYDVWRK